VIVVQTRPPLALESAPSSLGVEATVLRPAGGSRRLAWRGLIQGGLDQLVQPLIRRIEIRGQLSPLDSRIFQRRETRVLDVFTCWPPGPLDRLASSTISAIGMRFPLASIRSDLRPSLSLVIAHSRHFDSRALFAE